MRTILFQPRFAALIRSGMKRQTIRPIRKHPFLEGEPVNLREWSGLPYRSPQRPIRFAVIKTILPVEICHDSLSIWLGGTRLDHQAIFQLAKNDGFESATEMLGWFKATHKADRFEGTLIKWD